MKFLLLLLLASPALAQPSGRAFERLVEATAKSSTIRVTTSDGAFLVARPAAFADGLHHEGVLPPGQMDALPRVVPWEGVRKMEVRHSSAVGGALLGMMVGGGGAALAFQGHDRSEQGGAAAVGAGMGLLIGLFVGGSLPHWSALYGGGE